ncbi:MAG: AsmA-like C-terminal domain-containing protein, partial [Desulfobulbales bacterium]
LFQHSSFAAGALSGAFKISSFAEQPEATRFEGILKAENLFLKTKSSESTVFITNLDVTGIGRQLKITALNLAVGSEKITGSGQVAAEKDGIQLDLSLASSFFSRKSLVNLALALQETQKVFLDGYFDQEPGLQKARGWDITGRIGFDFDSFTLSRRTKTPYDEGLTTTYTFYDMLGDLQLAPDKISRTEIFSSKLCGLDFKGFWFSDDDLGQRFQLSTNPNETFRLENVLPCLGVQQDIMEGEFSIQANLLKESNSWYGGNIFIKSSQGRILRLKTLSRIFKVVNITDFFEKTVENTGKRGFPFTQMDIDTHIHKNNLIVDRAIILGEGLNLFARGEIHLDDYDADLTLLIAPFKTFDTIVSKVPIIGQPVAGDYGSRMSIPVAVKGPIADPIITPMHPEAVGGAFLNLLKDTFMLPYNILKPLEKLEKDSRVKAAEEK